MSNLGRIQKEHTNIGQIFGAHQNIINAEGDDALAMTRNLFTTAAALYHGSPAQKVQTVAGFIRTFGIDLQIQLFDGGASRKVRLTLHGRLGGRHGLRAEPSPPTRSMR